MSEKAQVLNTDGNNGLTPDQVDFRAKDFVARHNSDVDNRDYNVEQSLEFAKHSNTIHDTLHLADSGLSKALEGVKEELKKERNEWYRERSKSLDNVRKFDDGRKVVLFDAREHYEKNKDAYIEAAKKDAEEHGLEIELTEGQ